MDLSATNFTEFVCVCACVYLWVRGFIQDLAWPPVVNPDPIGHDAQSAAEILNENSFTHTPPKSPSRSPTIIHVNTTSSSEDVAPFCVCVRVCVCFERLLSKQ